MILAISQLAAFAPGLNTLEAWRCWAKQGSSVLPPGDDVPPLTELPALQRRRLDRAGRMALHVAWQCQSEPELAVPQVFASRHGDVGRTYRMLEQLATDGSVSPTQFGLSTHNAIAAQYSIARRFTGNYSAISAGPATAEAAVMEAQGLLADGAPAVLVVMYDEPLVADYAAFDQEPQAAYAWAVRLVAAQPDAPGFTLQADVAVGSPDGQASAPSLPHGLAVLRFLLTEVAELSYQSTGTLWCWRRR